MLKDYNISNRVLMNSYQFVYLFLSMFQKKNNANTAIKVNFILLILKSIQEFSL